MKKKKGFSLVELMVTLVVVAILTASMAPVITKRLKSKEITIAQGGGGLTMNCASISPQCGLCEGGVCVSCAKSCTENEALDIPNCACKLCSETDFHGEACLRCDMENCSKCTEGYYLASGNCTLCTDGYSCDGTNQNPCPAGYYCKDGITTACSAGTYNDTTGATNSSACIACSNKTANCTNCNIATGVCNTCESGYEIVGGSCNTTTFTYDYTGSYSETTSTDGRQKIILKTSGTFTPNATKKGTLFLVGGGGSGGGWAGGGGGGGYTNETIFTFSNGVNYSVTIGEGGAAVDGRGNGKTGGTTSFGNISALGGGGGYEYPAATGGAGTGNGGGGYHGNGQDGIAFDDIYYGGGGGAGGGSAGLGGGGQGALGDCMKGFAGEVNTGGGGGGGGGANSCSSYGGGQGGSGVAIIIIDN